MSFKPITAYDWLVVHCAATFSNMDIGRKEIRHWHLQRGFSDIGYHYVIRRDGTLEDGRPNTIPGAHARGYNLNSLGICLVGGAKMNSTKAENNFTPEQFDMLAKLLVQLLELHPDAEILGHCDLPGVQKACPSFDVRYWITTREELADYEYNDGTTPAKDKTPDSWPPPDKRCRGKRRKSRTSRI